MNKTHLIYAGVFTGGAVVGGLATYFVSRKHFDEHYSQLATDEIRSVREHYHSKEQALENEVRKDLYTEKLESLGYHSDTERPSPERLAAEDQAAEEVERIAVEIDIQDADQYPTTAETSKSFSTDETRNKTMPYLITQEEYSEEPSHAKISVTFYEADAVLADERDLVIDDVVSTVGDFLVSNFGKLSGDPNIMLIRNDRLMVDYEIARDERSYSEVVFGQ